MSVTIAIPTALRQFAGGQSEVKVEAATAGEALNLLTASHAELRRHLFNDQNALRNFVNVYLNDEDIRHQNGSDTPVKDGDTILIVPSIAGGSTVMDDVTGIDAGASKSRLVGTALQSDLPMLSNEEVARYSRHLIMPEVGMEGQLKLKAAKVLCIGAGGLGSPLALYLGAAGVGTLGIVDFDVVDFTNLQRQIIHSTADVGRRKLESAPVGLLDRRSMKTRLALFLTLIFAVASIVPSFAAGDRLALVIGNAKYPDAEAPLKEPINDARALTMALRRDGFDVEVVEDASKDDMSRAIGRLKSRIKPDSVVMLFFGGYGIQVGRESYMIPVDATIWRESDVRRGAISIESVLEMMKEQGARAKLVVLDASRRNPYERRFRAFSHGLAPINAADNALVLTSATPGKVADDSAGQYSVLMAELLTNLRDQQADKPAGEADNSGGQVDNSAGEATKPAGAETVFNKTRVAVAKSSEGEQVPSVSSSLVEEVRLGMSENSGG